MPSTDIANAKSFSVEKEVGNAKKTDVKQSVKDDEKTKFLSTEPSFPCFFFFQKTTTENTEKTTLNQKEYSKLLIAFFW